jgi:tRNA dimethylallyltransferase
LSTSSSTSVVVVAGPTASGKTALLDRLFGSRAAREAYGLPEAEIVSADSMQAYRGMDIGTAKPDAALLSRLPHHLIDILDPHEQYTAGDFARLADEACSRIRAAGKLPIVSGGTGFYIRNFIFGVPTAPPADPALRARVAEDLKTRGEGALRAELAAIDPESAERIHVNDVYRLTRAVEIVRATGRPLGEFASPRQPRKDLNFIVFGLELDRSRLYARIDERVDAMFKAGLVEEVAALAVRGYRRDDPGMRAIGYREFFDPETGGSPEGRACNTALLAAAIKQNTKHYAKRQLTFFRALPGIQWIEPDADAFAAVLGRIVQDGSFAL